MQAKLTTNVCLVLGALVAPLLLGSSCTSGVGARPAAAVPTGVTREQVITNTVGTPVVLTAQRMSTALRDGTSSPMWGFCPTAACSGAWAPGPTIVATAGTTLQITLHNALPVPTSLVILGQLGGGLGAPTKMEGPVHAGQNFTTFPGNAAVNDPGQGNAFTPPAQGPRVRSFGTEVAPSGSQTLTWTNLKAGTYLYETGTMPSLEVPMGLYGVLVVNQAPGVAYPGTPTGLAVDDDVALLFSEVDPVQNAAVDAAALAGADVNRRFNDPLCATQGPCYPAAVNYTPTYFLINGKPYDPAAPSSSAFTLGDTATSTTGKLLVRLLNAGSRAHVPALVGLPMALVAEDGNRLPGNPRIQSEALLVAGKTLDVILTPPGGAPYAPATYPIFDRSLSLSTANQPLGGMQGFILVNHAGAASTDGGVNGLAGATPVPGAPGNLPAAVTPTANDDRFLVPYNTAIRGNVTSNDIAVTSAAIGTLPQHGSVVLAADGTFAYTPSAGYSGDDAFTYVGNGTPASLTATVTLTVAAQLTGTANAPVAHPDTYASKVVNRFTAARPGVLGNDTDPHRFPLTAGSVTGATGCTVTLAADGSFEAVAAASATSCTFSYLATNSQGVSSAPALVTVSFGKASSLAVTVIDDGTGTPLSDYRWTLQEDLTFKHDVDATPKTNTRTVGTSFHRSHMTLAATGCVGAISCGSGQTVLDPTTGTRVETSDETALARQTTPAQAVLDPSKRYYLSVLPSTAADGDSGNAIGGGEVKPGATAGTWAPLTIKLRPSPLAPAQMSIYLYEDNLPTNGQDEPGESPLGGFNIVLFDPAGRTGDVAGQQSYDAFNMPLSNSLLGRPGCPDELNRATNGTATSTEGNLVGAIYTCPNDPNDGTPRANPARYALAGHALIKNLTPARYDVVAHPGAAREGAGEVWWQTETLEGTPAQDAFVGIGEPVYFQEFGPPGPHVTIGFVNPRRVASYAVANRLTGGHSITGQVTNQHMSRPSNTHLHDSKSFDLLSSTTCQVVLNSQSGAGPAIAAAQCDADGKFTLTNVPAGDFDLAVFDQWLDQIIQNVAVSVPPAQKEVAMGTLPVLSWFTQYDQNIFLDANRNGIMDDGETGIANVPLTVRFRDGSLSNVTLTDSNGNGTLPELFPLFNWYVAEADSTRYKQTGVHIIVDSGGKPDTTGIGAGLWASTYPGGKSSERVDLGTGQSPRPTSLVDGSEAQPAALSYGLQGFISQRSHVEWGRTTYAPHENGGIQGTVVYASTRPFDDMRFNIQNIWAPLIPRVKVNLYQRQTLADGTSTLSLVDTTTTSSWDDYVNLVQGADGHQYLLGSDGTLRDPTTGALAGASALPAGKQVNLQCPGQLKGTTSRPPWNTDEVDPFTSFTLGITGSSDDQFRCFDGWHGWNQIQAAPYDGRYVFPSAAYIAAHPLGADQLDAGQTLVSLPPGTYVVEEVTPPGYTVVKEEDKNILIGDAFIAPVTQQFGGLSNIFILPDQATLASGTNGANPGTGDPGFQSDPTTDLGVSTDVAGILYPECVGNPHRVPDYLSLFPQARQVAPFAGMDRPLCDRKQVVLGDQMAANASFFLFSEVPLASNNTGIILDDASSEFNAFAPDFGEKASVPFVPVSLKDSSGLEIGRTYSDQWGAYNLMTPSSWLVNPPTPSGFGPNMLITCINDPGPIPNPAGGSPITDPHYNPAYSNFCYTNPYMPGRTTYLDTPVLPIAAFAAGYNPPDCAPQQGAPVVKRVDGVGFGPYVPASGGTLTITAQGDQLVPNPAYSGPFATSGLASKSTITRHYGFGSGAGGVVKVGNVPLTQVVWRDDVITGNVPPNTPSGELSITTSAGVSAIDTVTVTVGGKQPKRVSAGGSIQATLDAADPGDLILIDEGTYNELVVMWKPVRLQGVGAAAVIINAAKFPNTKLDAWRPLINELFSVDATTGNLTGTPQVDPLPTQEITGGVVLLEPSVLGSEEGAGITVLAKNLNGNACSGGRTSTFRGHRVTESNFRCKPSRIDGLSVTGGDSGGGIYVNGWAHGLEISNTRVYGNAGAFNGGIRIGVPYLELEELPQSEDGQIGGLGYDTRISIHHNSITRNGGLEGTGTSGGAGGGLSICAGTDNYLVDHNFICGNVSSSHGGAIGHLGFSQNGKITNNQLLFNQSFQQSNSTHGGGIAVVGEPPVAGAVTLGTGDLLIDHNLIRGNFAEAGQGGGIRLQQVNGADVARSPNNPQRWHTITVTSNKILDNVAGWAGGGISLSDTLRARISSNEVASNDSVGIAGVVLLGNGPPVPATGTGTIGKGYPSAAGLVSEHTSAQLLALLPAGNPQTLNAISQPAALSDNRFWKNRSFYYSGDGQLCTGNSRAAPGGACQTVPDQVRSGECPTGAAYWDLGVLGDASVAPAAVRLRPTGSTITSIAGYDAPALGNTSTAPSYASNLYCNGSRVMPEQGPVINPPAVLNLQVSATLDEGNNYVNLRYGPLYLGQFGSFAQ